MTGQNPNYILLQTLENLNSDKHCPESHKIPVTRPKSRLKHKLKMYQEKKAVSIQSPLRPSGANSGATSQAQLPPQSQE